MSVTVKKIDFQELLDAYLIRERVFVEEQKVPKEFEIDEFENVCQHYLARDDDGKAIGTARWRKTDRGFKLERFAILKEWRGKGIGSLLVKKVLEDVQANKLNDQELVYLHSQVDAIPLYAKFGFKQVGKQFEECGILHCEMTLTI